MIKIKLHYLIMPWQIDYALLSYTQLKKSFYYLPKDVEVTIDTHLNLSNYIMDWDESKLPKDFFINKFNDLSSLLKDYKVNSFIYEGDENYGLLDMQRMAYGEEFDYYIPLCPDIEFDETTLFYLIEAARNVKNKYFVITPQIYKKWDSSWDDLTDKNFVNLPYRNWDEEIDLFKLRNQIQNAESEVYIEEAKNHKWAIWFDIYSKSFYEELCPIQEDWIGYGPWDFYSMVVSEQAKNLGVDIQAYILRGKTILDYTEYTSYYKNMLSVKVNAPEQRAIFEAKMPEYINKALQNLKQKNII
jgi:hypothetical protein